MANVLRRLASLTVALTLGLVALPAGAQNASSDPTVRPPGPEDLVPGTNLTWGYVRQNLAQVDAQGNKAFLLPAGEGEGRAPSGGFGAFGAGDEAAGNFTISPVSANDFLNHGEFAGSFKREGDGFKFLAPNGTFARVHIREWAFTAGHSPTALVRAQGRLDGLRCNEIETDRCWNYISEANFGGIFGEWISRDGGRGGDFSALVNDRLNRRPLLATSTTTISFPLVDGAATWPGPFFRRETAYQPPFPGFSRLGDEDQEQDRFTGDQEVFFVFDDHLTAQRGTGIAAEGSTSWPMGLSVAVQGFAYSLPQLNQTNIFQMSIINDSGNFPDRPDLTPTEYDSLFIGGDFLDLSGGTQVVAWGVDLKRGMMFNHSGTQTDERGFRGYVILGSPMGDQRNKLFSDPESEFFDPANPAAADTFTFHSFHGMNFGEAPGSDVARFVGAFHQIQALFNDSLLTVAGRDTGAVLDRFCGQTVLGNCREDSQSWMQGTLDSVAVRAAVPPQTLTPRTGLRDQLQTQIFFDPAGQIMNVVLDETANGPAQNGFEGLARRFDELFSDGAPDNNTFAQFGYYGVGPIRLAPGDTIEHAIAMVGADDRLDLNRRVDDLIRFWNAFLLTPKAPPSPNIVAVDSVSVEGEIQVCWDTTAEDAVDPFLETFGFSEPARQNLAEIRLFRSNDAGRSFGAESRPQDAVIGRDGAVLDFGFRPLRRILADDEGNLSQHCFTDENAIPGVGFIYSLGTVSKGFVDEETAQEVAPILISGLAADPILPSVVTSRNSPPPSGVQAPTLEGEPVITAEGRVEFSFEVGEGEVEVLIIDPEGMEDATISIDFVEISGEFGYEARVNGELVASTTRLDGTDGVPVVGGLRFITDGEGIEVGDNLTVSTTGAFVDPDEITLDDVAVVPNPYIAFSQFQSEFGTTDARKVRFINLPPEASIRVYTITGVLLDTIEHTDGTGFEFWDLRTDEEVEVGYGIYIWVVTTPDGKKQIGRLGVIR